MILEAFGFWATVKHGREIVEFRLAVNDSEEGQAFYTVRIDLARLARLGRKAEENRKGVARRGPIQVRRKGTWA